MILLDRIQSSADLKSLTREELAALAAEMRARLIDVCSRTGGHIGAGLGVVELTIALHYVFDTPVDQLVWDVGPSRLPAQDAHRAQRSPGHVAAGGRPLRVPQAVGERLRRLRRGSRGHGDLGGVRRGRGRDLRTSASRSSPSRRRALTWVSPTRDLNNAARRIATSSSC
jgi:hypothetical protein